MSRNILDVVDAIEGAKSFFDGEWFSLRDTKEIEVNDIQDSWQKLEGGECEPFNHCYVDQNGGGITGDDFHGTVYFHLIGKLYLVTEY